MRVRKGQIRETLARGVMYMVGIHPCTQLEKKKIELQETLNGEWRFFIQLDPDFATNSFKCTP